VYDRVVSLVVEFYEKPEDNSSSTSSSASDEEGEEEWDSADKKALPYACRITLTVGAPPEMTDNPEEDDARHKFVRWVMFPTAYDEQPKQDGDQGPGGQGNPK